MVGGISEQALRDRCTMRILVTGGAGNIGRGVVARLQKLGHQPFVYDLQPYPTRRVRSMVGNICDPTQLRKAFEQIRPEGVVHLAGILQFACDIDCMEAVRVNVEGTAEVLEFARKCGVKRFVFASSAALYGPTSADLYEDSPIEQGVSIYGVSKLLGERLLEQYRKRYGLICRTVRLSTVLSHREVSGPGVAAAVRKLLDVASGRSVTVEGVAAHERRHYVYVSDAVEGIVRALLTEECKDQVFNISGGPDMYVSFGRVADLAREMLCSEGGAVAFLGASGDRGRMHCTRAAMQLGYRPDFNLERAMQEVIEKCRITKQRN